MTLHALSWCRFCFGEGTHVVHVGQVEVCPACGGSGVVVGPVPITKYIACGSPDDWLDRDPPRYQRERATIVIGGGSDEHDHQ